jgi:hypothetical protein
MRKFFLSAIFVLLLLSISGCNLSFLNLNPTPYFPTPNYTMTALFTVDESLITETPQDFAVNTLEPVLPTVQSTDQISESPTEEATQIIPSATSTSISIPPTNTPLPPTSTKTEVTVRGGTWVSGKYMKNPPSYDGVWDEWEATKYPAKAVVYGVNEWKNSEDLEGSFRVAWNETYLFIAVKVYDDIYAQNADGQDIYKGDSVEILLDTNLYGDLSTASLNSDDFQIGISPGKGSLDGETETFLWFPSGKAGSLDNVLIASTSEDDVYRVEIGIPWSVFNITPASGQQYGLGVSVSDNDDTSKDIQQSMVSNLPYRGLTDPTSWTVLTLVK